MFAICFSLFHTLRTFRREVSWEKLGITAGERVVGLELFQKMAYASSEEEYQGLCKELEENCPKQVRDYFKDNWAKIKDEWVLHYKAMCGSFLNSTNNKLESLNGKLKIDTVHLKNLLTSSSSFFQHCVLKEITRLL